ncbi:hypothetical protein BaRGS_00010425, partial [Batillaria attramentaria]
VCPRSPGVSPVSGYVPGFRVCPRFPGVSPVSTRWRYDWDRSTENWIISAYFIGYYMMQFPAGWLSKRLGEKRVVLVGAASLACLQGFAIVAADLGPNVFLVTMLVTGFANGCIFTSTMAVVAKWSPPQENNCLSTLAVSGSGLGMAFVFGLSAITNSVEFIGGWPLNFITFGTNPLASDSDLRTCVGNSIGTVRSRLDYNLYDYFIEDVDMLCGLPWAGSLLVGGFVSYLADAACRKGVSVDVLRKTAEFMAKPACATLLLLMSFVPDGEDALVILLYTTSVLLLLGFEGSGYIANIAELSPEYTGIIWSVSQTVGMTSSFIVPVVLGAITPNNTRGEWRTCFLLIFGVDFVTFLVYLVFASNTPQHWSTEEERPLVLAKSGE